MFKISCLCIFLKAIPPLLSLEILFLLADNDRGFLCEAPMAVRLGFQCGCSICHRRYGESPSPLEYFHLLPLCKPLGGKDNRSRQSVDSHERLNKSHNSKTPFLNPNNFPEGLSRKSKGTPPPPT